MEKLNSQQLDQLAKQLRIDVVESLAAAGSGHIGGSLGLADVFAVLYGNILNHNPQQPKWENRDRLILSIGHVAPILYAALAESGYFSREELTTLRKLGTRLQGHPSTDHGLPGIELAAGSLGQGLSVAIGMALTAKIDKASWKVFSIHGDGELQEGSIWEAAMSAAHYKLDNLIALVDRNYCQIDGPTSHVMEIEPLANKWAAFGWNVINCNGNNIDDLLGAYNKATAHKGSPTVIIAQTKMGCGVHEIENDFHWHGKAPNSDEAKRFIAQIEQHHSQTHSNVYK